MGERASFNPALVSLGNAGMRRPLLLDLYCKAGGAAMGYYLAGFDVVGVDKVRQRNYPSAFPFICADVLTLNVEWLRAFDAIHASPPCQFASDVTPDKSKHTNLIPATRALLDAAGRPYVIENVEGALAHLRSPVVLCGSMFNLGAMIEGKRYDLERHRGFEVCGFDLPQPECQHTGRPVVGVYGGHVRRRAGEHRTGGKTDKTAEFPSGLSHTKIAREALGMEWGTLNELSEAIPPAYTKYIGGHLLQQLGDHHVQDLGKT